MTEIEVKFFDWIQKHILTVLFIAASVFGLALHFFGLDFHSDDYRDFLLPWWNSIESSGINSLSAQVGNYNIPYQIIIFLMTLLPFGPLLSYKILSIVFDFVLAAASAAVVKSFDKNSSGLKTVLTYAIVLCSVLVILNSSFWAQCDSIYVAFILLAIYFIHKDKHILSFVMLGIAIAFKLQTVFITPAFLYYYISTRKVSILHFLIIPLVDIAMCLPAIIFGRNFTDIFTIYAEQTDYGKLIQMNCPNFWALICEWTDTSYYFLFKRLAICLTILILGIGIALIIYKKIDLSNKNSFLITSLWTVFTCIMFLPSMHERYGYLLDILAIIYVTVTAKRIWLAAALNLVSLRGYSYYLFANYQMLDLRVTALLYMSLYVYISLLFIKEVVCGSAQSDKANAKIKPKKA